jgi:hypothetical protein
VPPKAACARAASTVLSSLMFPDQGGHGLAGAREAVRAPKLGLQWLFPAVSFSLALLLGVQGAIYSPDALAYRLLALGQNGAVARPFSGRILGAAAAGWLGRVTSLGVDRGFLLFGIICLLTLLVLVVRLLWSWRASTIIFAAIFLMPFWVDLLRDYYLPDLLHAAILAALLLALASSRPTLAMLLLFPAYVARESTQLIVLCLLWAAWRRIPARAAVAGVLAVAGGAIVNRHYGNLGAASVQGMGTAAYLFGKVGWSFFHNVVGLPLWSNILPECKSPLWVISLPHGEHLGAVRMIGLCQPSAWGPARVALSWFGLFGVGPALALALFRPMLSLMGSARSEGGASVPDALMIVYRFSFIYGLVSWWLAPLLGASTDRLVEYAWPFFFVALPLCLAVYSRLLPGVFRARAASLLALHLAVCWIAWFAFRSQSVAAYVYAVLAAFILNTVAYRLIRPSIRAQISTARAARQTA